MDLETLQLISRFSLPPNSLGYCGTDSGPEKLKKCVTEGKCNEVEEEIESFIVLHPYLKTISEIIKAPKFSHKVVEAYWLGNDEIKKAKPEHYEILLKNFEEQGMPKSVMKKLRKKSPEKFYPTHLFQVLHSKSGEADKSSPYMEKAVNNCIIRWGKVEKVDNQEITIDLNSVKKTNDKYKIVKIEEIASNVPGFVPKIKVGSVAAVHWGQVVKILTPGEEKKISFWTSKVLKNR